MSKDGDVRQGSRHGRRSTEAEGTAQGKGPTGTPPPAAGEERRPAAKPPLELKITPLDGRDTLKYEDVADK